MRPAPTLAGRIEVRGLGIRALDYEPFAVVGLVVDLAAADAERLPRMEATETSIEGVWLPRLASAPGDAPLPVVLAALRLSPSPLNLGHRSLRSRAQASSKPEPCSSSRS